MNSEVFEQEMQKSTTYGVCDGPSCLWRSVGGIVGKLLKMGKSDQVWGYEVRDKRRSHDGPFYRFVMKIIEVDQYPNSKSLIVMERDPRRTVVPVTIRHTFRRW